MNNFKIREVEIELNNIKVQFLDFIVEFEELSEIDKHSILESINIVSGFKLINLYYSLEKHI